MTEVIEACRQRGLHHLPDLVDGKHWRGRGGIDTLSRAELAEKVYQVFHAHVPSWLSKAQLVAALEFKRRIISTPGDGYDNTMCPLTQEDLEDPVFVRVTSSGYRRGFSLESIADYFLSSGSVLDPVDREPFTQDDLVRMDAALKVHGIERKSVANITSDAEQQRYREQRESEEIAELLEDAIREVFPVVARDILALHRIKANTSGARRSYRSIYTFRKYCHACARHGLQKLVDISASLCSEIDEQEDWRTDEKRAVTQLVEEVVVEAITENAHLCEQPMGIFWDDQHFEDASVLQLVVLEMSEY